MLLYVAGALAVVLVVVFLIPERTSPEPDEADDGSALHTAPADGGFPMPPMDLVVPPTPRSLRRPAVMVGAPTDPTREDQP